MHQTKGIPGGEDDAQDALQYSTVQYSTVQCSTVQLLTLAAREESGSSVRRHSWVRSWAQHMPCMPVYCEATVAPLRVVRPHLELVLVLLRVHAVVHDGQQPGGALQGVGAARLWRLGRYH